MIGYHRVPEPFVVTDEWTNVLHGLSIRSTGIPAAWSDLRFYWDYEKQLPRPEGITREGFNLKTVDYSPGIMVENSPKLLIFVDQYDFGVGKMHTALMQPYLDHPPAGALVLSSLVPSNINKVVDLKSADYRLTSVWLASLTTVLIFLLGWQIFKNLTIGVIAATVYATVPTFLILSRMALLENVLIPVQLVVLNILVFAQNKARYAYTKNIYRTLLFVAGAFSGLAFLTKTTGLAVILAGVVILFMNKNSRKDILFFAVPAVVVSIFYFLWGAWLSFDLFLGVLNEQSNKRIFVGSLSFLTSIVKFGMKSFPVDGWWVGGFLSLLWLKMDKEMMPLTVSVASLVFMILFGGASGFPWYVIPLIPFMCLMVGYLLWQIVTKPTTLNILLFFLIFFSSSFYWGYGVKFGAPNFINHQQQFILYKVLLVVFFISAILVPRFYQSGKLKIVWPVVAMGVLLYVVSLNYHSIMFMLEQWGNLQIFYTANWQF